MTPQAKRFRRQLMALGVQRNEANRLVGVGRFLEQIRRKHKLPPDNGYADLPKYYLIGAIG